MRKCKECKWFIDGKCMLVSEIKEAKTEEKTNEVAFDLNEALKE